MFSELKHILLADDDKDDCLFFHEALEELSISTKVTTVHDGEQLMRKLTEESELPHVLFLDLNMPRKDGFTCLKEIKKDVKLKKLPVIIFSTPCEQEVADQLFDCGACLYICKPTDFSKLKNVIGQALSRIIKSNTTQRAKDNFMLQHQ